MEETIRDRLLKVAFDNNYNSLRQMAEACGVNYANLVRISNGKKGDRTLRRLANFFKVSYDWLTTGCGLCGVEGDNALNELTQEFNRVYGSGNTMVNNISNGSHQTNSIGVHGESEALLLDKIKLLEDKIRMLESSLADKDRIIKLITKNEDV